MKVCNRCKQDKPLLDFNKKRDGLQSLCKDCSRKASKEYYEKNKETHKAFVTKRRISNKKIIDKYIRELKESKPCLDCNVKYPYYVMDFDHQRDKIKAISKMVSSSCSLETIKKEIEKCEIICSNCHRIRTFSN